MTEDSCNSNSHSHDSAGVPWAGRHFEPNAFAADDGSAPPRLAEALTRHALGSVDATEVVALIAESRFLIPLLAERGETGVTPDGRVVDKSAELAVVTVSTPDGLTGLPVFTSVAAMTAWNSDARPVPADGLRVALAAVDGGTARIIIDPGSKTQFAVRRPAIEAIAAEREWGSPFADERILAAFMEPASEYAVITSLVLMPGDPAAALLGPEVLVQLTVMRGLDAGQLKIITDDLSQRWQADPLIAARVDSVGIRLAPDPNASLT